MITEQNCTMLCDFYQLTMGNGYYNTRHADRIAYFDVFFRKVPDGGGYAVCAGLEQVINYIQGLHFTDDDIQYLRGKKIFSEGFLKYLRDFKFTGDIWAVPEGTPVFPSEPLLTDPALQLLKTLLSAPSGGRGASSRVVTAELQVALQAADVAGTLLRVMGHNPADSALAAQSFGLLAQWCAVCSRASEAMDDPAFAETLAAYLEAAHLAPAAVPTLLQILNAVLTSGGRARRR